MKNRFFNEPSACYPFRILRRKRDAQQIRFGLANYFVQKGD
jgi:hypothetical protein